MGKMKQLLEMEDEMDNYGYWSKAFVIEAIDRMEKGAISADAKSYYSIVRQYFETLAGYHPELRVSNNKVFPAHDQGSIP
jgi:hypothetical protein